MKSLINAPPTLAANTARRIGKTLSLLLCWMVLVLCMTQLAVAQEVIVHFAFSSDDGDPKKDADGAKNEVVVWKGGAVHVTDGNYFVDRSTQTLVIQPGAIVKIAGRCTVDANGQLISCEPPFNAGISSGSQNGIIQIDGATITDIRDDSEGGDTNRDGNGSSVPASGISSYLLRFSGTAQDYLRNSIIKYCTTIGHMGSMNITRNKFINLVSFRSSSLTGPVVLNAVPVISGNTFELVTGSVVGVLDLRGMSPIVENNTIRGGNGIWIGPSREFPGSADFGNPVGPTTGTTVISNNRFEGGNYGVRIYTVVSDTLYTQTRFRAEIRSNTFRGGNTSGTALELALDAQASILSNEVSGYVHPLRLTYNNKTATSRLEIMFNRFSLEGTDQFSGPGGVPEQLWKNGQFVKAENNFWGHPTGPLDNSNADGLSNPRGKGLKMGDGIDYMPFIGGSSPPLEDDIRITASSNPAQPLQPTAAVIFNLTVDYELKSAATGKIVVLVRDADGIILNQPGTSVDVTSANRTATIPPVNITVPEFGNVVTVEAALVPDNGAESPRSNVQPFVVAQPAGSLSLNITELPSGGSPVLGRGNKTRTKLALKYTLTATSNGHLEIEIKERARGTGVVLKEFSPLMLDAPPGNNTTVENEVELDIPLRDVLKEPKSELYVTATLKDGAGAILDRKDRTIPIDETINAVRFGQLLITKASLTTGAMPLGRSHFLVGELPSYVCAVFYRIGTKNATTWQVWVGDDKLLDAKGNVIHQYTVLQPSAENLSTGPEREVHAFIGSSRAIPVGVRKNVAYVRLVAPGNLTVAYGTYNIEVREAAQTALQAVPAGASQVAFNLIPVTLNFASNQEAGTAFAEEFAGQFGAAAAGLAALAKASQANDFYWEFIPLNRYWAVYDTLKDGTFSATVSFTYNSATDFPAVPGFNEDSLVVAGLNPFSQQLEALPSTLNKATRTISTAYTKFFDTYVVASKTTVIITAVSSKPNTAIPERFALAQNYPNPFNPSTTIAFSLPRASQVTLKVFNLVGQEVATLVDKKFSAGRYDVHWDAAGHANGIYFYRIQAESFVRVQKMLLIR